MAKEKELKAKPIHYRATVSNTLFVALNTLFMVLFVIITLYPVLNTLAISFNDGTDALRGGIYLLPRKWSTQNYTTVLQKDNLITGAYISVLRTVIGTLTALAANALLAFIVSRKRFLFRRQLSLFWVITMYVNGGMIPVFLLYKGLGLTNSFWVYIIPAWSAPSTCWCCAPTWKASRKPGRIRPAGRRGLHDHLCQDHLPAVPAGLRHGRPVRGGRAVELLVRRHAVQPHERRIYHPAV